ncbi:hypothetical protein RDWZM_004904 [Blomia tropicalis]|uniref:ER membrane protein complex subunit 1 n=1 Tax=Blomia tropicalis TaxID=40697 RepID=A0A9Q0M7Q1_BLOTA|nr:hypothetical protein RDWZM_004904 [Blomia tropicalis]
MAPLSFSHYSHRSISKTLEIQNQVGKFDWRHQFVGRVQHILRPSTNLWQNHQSLIVSTHNNVLTGLYLRNGSIQWRHPFETSDSINFISSGFENIIGNSRCPVLSVNGNGRYVRCWSTDGLLLSEHNLPSEYCSELENLSSNDFTILYDTIVDPATAEPLLLIAKLSYSKHLVEFFTFGLKTTTFASVGRYQTGRWLSPDAHCDLLGRTIRSKTLACGSTTDGLDLQLLTVDLTQPSNPPRQFKRIPLSTFGLKNDQQTAKYLSIERLPYQSNEDQSTTISKPVKSTSLLFAVNLGGDGYVILSLKSENEAIEPNVELVKVLPKAVKLTIIPLMSSEGTHDSSLLEFGLAALFIKEQSIAYEDRRDGEHNQRVFAAKLVVFHLEKWVEIGALSSDQMLLEFGAKSAISPIVSSGKLVKRLDSTWSIDRFEILPIRISTENARTGRNQHRFTYKMALVTNDGTLILLNLSGKINWAREEALAEIVDTMMLDLPLSETDASLEQEYSFDVIILRTKVGKIFAIDSLTGNVIWSKYEPMLKLDTDKTRFPIWVQRTSAHFPHSAVCTTLSELSKRSESILYSFDPFTGETIESRLIPHRIAQAMLINTIHDEQFRRPILFLEYNELRAHFYPDSDSIREQFSRHASNYYMLIANQTSNLVVGYSFRKSDQTQPLAIPVWSFNIPKTGTTKIENLMAVFKRPTEHVHSQGRVLGDRNVLYKYLNPNLVAIVWEAMDTQDKPLITLYLIDSITGNIVYSIIHRRSRGPIQIVHSENWVIYSYYNEKLRRNEVSSIELFEGFEQVNGTAFSSIGRNLLALPIVEQQSFIFPTGIGIMTDTETQKGITNKHILISLPTGGLLELPRAFLDPRRPIKPSPESQEEGLIPYTPELPIPSEAMINYNQTIFGVKGITTSPTSLESTSLVFAYGLDIFFTRVTPSKTFDILKDDFDFWLIAAVLVALIVFSYLAKMLASRKSLNAAWK